MRRPRRAAAVLAALALALTACTPAASVAGAGPADAEHEGPRVVTTTPVIADLVRQVGGDRVHVTSLVPAGVDPHEYEPTLRQARDVAYADVAFANHLLLEQESQMRLLRSTLPDDAPLVALSEESAQDGIDLLPVVENPILDQLWLGARNDDAQGRALQLRLDAATGPGDAHAFLTRTFGTVEAVFDSRRPGGTLALPAGAHTHLSWAFTRPGRYTLTLTAVDEDGAAATEPTDVVVLVGTPAEEHPDLAGRRVVDAGHADLAMDPDARRVAVRAEREGTRGGVDTLAASDVVLAVTPRAVTEVPPSAAYRFLGTPGTEVYLLPQAVVGRHVHGSLDPHVWLDPHNAAAWTGRIERALSAADPEHAAEYRANAAAAQERLRDLRTRLAAQLADLPPERRRLVTTHDAYAYLARAFDLEVAGFAVPATAAQPGPRGQGRLAATLRDLKVPAVFAQPGDAGQDAALRRMAAAAGIPVCELSGDIVDPADPTYEALLTRAVTTIHDCLAPDAPPAATADAEAPTERTRP